MDECVFCLIRDGQAQASVVYQDDLVLAFMDLRPINPGHVLVLPRMHVPDLGAIPDQVGARMWSVGRRLGAALRAGPMRCEGINLLLADGQRLPDALPRPPARDPAFYRGFLPPAGLPAER